MPRKWPPQISFYIYPNEEELFKKLKEIANREGRSVTEILKEMAREYVRRHEPGNPQLRLDKILAGEPRPGMSPRCRFCDRLASYVQYWVRNRNWTEQVPVCDVHRKRARQAPLLEYGERRL